MAKNKNKNKNKRKNKIKSKKKRLDINKLKAVADAPLIESSSRIIFKLLTRNSSLQLAVPCFRKDGTF